MTTDSRVRGAWKAHRHGPARFNRASALLQAVKIVIVAKRVMDNANHLGPLRMVTLREAVYANIPPEMRVHQRAIRDMIAGKWKYAAGRYRHNHPGVLPDQKHQPGTVPCSRLLPIDVAEAKMR
ncbi:hypothetical protein Vretimale_12156, partial [Volvox reticuliferus]